MAKSFAHFLEAIKSTFDGFFVPYLKSSTLLSPESKLKEAILYSILAGGKRFRPCLVIANSLESLEETPSHNSLLLGASVECIHTYSLVHDDLPAMDNDDLRRGKPTNHKVYGESTAILVGDALNALGFGILGDLDSEDLNLVKDCLRILHKGAGYTGMVLGQWEDIQGEKGQSNFSHQQLSAIHAKKTGALIVTSFLLGNRLRKDFYLFEKATEAYSKSIGLVFQIQDDILDVEGSKENLGKTPGKDQATGKLTYPSLFGLEGSKKLLKEELEKALENTIYLPKSMRDYYEELPKFLANRKS